ALDEIHRMPRHTRERRPEVREEIPARAAQPGEAEKCRERLPERRLRDTQLSVERVRDAERPEHGVERGAPAVRARADDADRLGGRPGAEQPGQLVAHELERTACAGALEESNGAVDGDRGRRRVVEEPALEMCERRVRSLAPSRRQLLDARSRKPLEVLGGAPERRERGPAWLVRKRDRDLGPPGERLEQRPLGAGQVLEAVREDGLAVPRVELGAQPLDRAAPDTVAVPQAEAVELGSVRGVEDGEVPLQLTGSEQAGLNLAERLEERVREAAEARRRGKTAELRLREHAPDDERALRVRDRPAAAGDPLEDVVERADRAREERRTAGEQLALDALDIRSVRHDEHGLPLDGGEIAV